MLSVTFSQGRFALGVFVLFLFACPTNDPSNDGGSEETAEDGGSEEDLSEFVLPVIPVTALYVYPDDSTSVISEAINSAQSSVDVVTFQFMSSSSMLDALLAAEDRGVRVRVILEATVNDNPDTKQQLEAGGVEVHWGSSLVNLTHEKSVRVDDQKLLVMSLNFSNAGMFQNREHIAVVTDSAAVTEAAAVFNADWENQSSTGQVRHLVYSPDNSRETITELLRTAETSIDVQNQLISDGTVLELLKAKASRGIPVRVIVPDPDDQADSADVAAALTGSGVEVRYLSTHYVHTKMMLVDDKLFVGSINFSHNAITNNRELGLVTESSAALLKAREYFEIDWDDASTF